MSSSLPFRLWVLLKILSISVICLWGVLSFALYKGCNYALNNSIQLTQSF